MTRESKVEGFICNHMIIINIDDLL